MAKATVHFAPFGKPKTVCGLPQLRNGMVKTEDWTKVNCLGCLTEKPSIPAPVFPPRPPEPPVEGMPGTWSHCGSDTKHGAHRHSISVNEGLYENILCLGFPGDPNGYSAPVRLVYPKPEVIEQFAQLRDAENIRILGPLHKDYVPQKGEPAPTTVNEEYRQWKTTERNYDREKIESDPLHLVLAARDRYLGDPCGTFTENYAYALTTFWDAVGNAGLSAVSEKL